MLDIARYAAAKAAKSISLQKYGESVMFIQRQFDPTSGAELAPSTGVFTREQLAVEKAKLEQMLASVNALLADVDAMQTPPLGA